MSVTRAMQRTGSSHWAVSREHGDPHHPDNDGDEHGEEDEPSVPLPVLTRPTEGGFGDEEREGQQEEDVNQEDREVHVELTGCHIHKHRTPGHDESHILSGDDRLQQADTNSNAQNRRPRGGPLTPDQLHQVGGMSPEARETDSKEDPEEKVADGGSLLAELDEGGKSKAEEPQRIQEEEELGGEDIPLAAVLNPSREEEKCQGGKTVTAMSITARDCGTMPHAPVVSQRK